MEKDDGPLMATWKKEEWGEKGIGRRKKRGGERSKEGKEKEDEEKGEEKEGTSSGPEYVLQLPTLSDLL